MSITLMEICQASDAIAKDPSGLAFRRTTHLAIPDFRQMDLSALHDYRRSFTKTMEGKKEELAEEEFTYGMSVMDCLNNHIDYRNENAVKGPVVVDGQVVGVAEGPFGGSRSSNDFTPAAQTRTEDPRKVTSRSLFPHIQPATRHELNTWGKFLTAIAARIHHPELEESRTMLLGSGPLGGYGAGPQLVGAVIDGILEQSRLLQLCNVIPGGESGEVRIPVYDNSDHSVSLYGGISRQFPGENSTATPSDAKMRLVTMILHRLCIYSNVTNILLQASPQKEVELRQILIEALTYAVEESVLTGTGVNQPRGIVDSSGAVVVNRTTANTVVYSDIVNMFARLAPGSQSRAVWVANYNILPSLLTMQDPGNRYIWAPVGYTGAAQALPASLLGREIIFTEKSPALGSKGDLMLVDFKGYAVCLTPQIGVQTSDAPRWYENERSFRIETRVDGTMLLDEPIVPRKGADTLSTTVVLNA